MILLGDVLLGDSRHKVRIYLENVERFSKGEIYLNCINYTRTYIPNLLSIALIIPELCLKIQV